MMQRLTLFPSDLFRWRHSMSKGCWCCEQAAMQLTPAQQGEFVLEADAMTRRLCEIVRQHKALLLDICRAPLTASSNRPDTVSVRLLYPVPGPSVNIQHAQLGSYEPPYQWDGRENVSH